MTRSSRRYTDREVALVLRRATEIDEREGVDATGGLSLEELKSIGAEVGISRDAIERAVASLERGARMGPSLLGAPAMRKAVHAVDGELGEEAIADLVRIVDERADGAGSVSEALGSVRWTSAERFKSTRVSITPARERTTIEVVEKAEPRLRYIFHFLPATWGAMLAAPFIEILALPALGAAGAVALGLAAGGGIGRLVWNLVSAASDRRVHRLADALAEEAGRGAPVGAASTSEAPPGPTE